MENKKIDLTDVTYIIPIRIDSVERLENLFCITNYLLENFDTNIIVLEASESKTELLAEKLSNKIDLYFVEDNDRIFHRTKYLNVMTSLCSTKYIGIWDADVVVIKEQICQSIQLLRKGEASFVFPYDGHFLDVTVKIRLNYIKYQSIDILKQNQEKMRPPYGKRMIGGGIFVNKADYCAAGMENEKFYGWGPEDAERLTRWEIMGFNIQSIEGPLFHLCHPRLLNSRFAKEEIQKNNLRELILISEMSKTELLKEINKWHHLKTVEIVPEKIQIISYSTSRNIQWDRLKEFQPPIVKFPFHIRVGTADENVLESIFAKHDYIFFAEKQPRFIIDAGAHIGLASIFFANIYPESTIISLEPETENFKLLCQNVNSYPSIIPINAALWKKKGRVKLADPNLGNWGYRVSQLKPEDKIIEQQGTDVEAVTINDIIQEYNMDKVDILKMDVEGAEKEVFENTSEWIEKVDSIIIELHERLIEGCNRSFYNGTTGFDKEWSQGENIILSRKGCLSKL